MYSKEKDQIDFYIDKAKGVLYSKNDILFISKVFLLNLKAICHRLKFFYDKHAKIKLDLVILSIKVFTKMCWLVAAPTAVTEEEEDSAEDTPTHQAHTQHRQVRPGEGHRDLLSTSISQEEEHR